MLIGYARISTGDQSLNLQLDALKTAGCEKIFEDTASGVKTDRPGLADALTFARQGDTLTVWKLDRLGRSLSHLIKLIKELADRGVGFKSLQENIDTTTPTGRLFFHIMASLAEFERELIRERTRAGLEAAKRRGAKSGRKFLLNNEQLKIMKTLLAEPDHNTASVARVLNVSARTIKRNMTRTMD